MGGQSPAVKCDRGEDKFSHRTYSTRILMKNMADS